MTLLKQNLLEFGETKIAIEARGSGPLVLFLHGWLDNLASFSLLLEQLKVDGLQCVTIDFPGHGKSAHRPAGTNQYFVDLVWVIYKIYDYYKPERLMLVGHSMGAGAASLFAGTFPELVSHLVLLDGLGPISSDAEDGPQNLQQALLADKPGILNPGRIYKSLAIAAAVRSKVGSLDIEAARLLCERGMHEQDGGFQWSYDPRLKTPSLMRLTEDQVISFLKRIESRCLLVRAKNSRVSTYGQLMTDRIEYVKNCQVETIPGGHHLHMDQAEKVAELIQPLLNEYRVGPLSNNMD